MILAGQGFALGVTVAWITIPASAIFLAAYGAELLPVTYLGAAVAGIVSSAALAAAFRRTALISVAKHVLAGLSISLLASWALLSRWEANWVSFGLLALVPLTVPIGFVFVVGQAGMLLDVRALKASYARVVAGFALGFVSGGLAGPPLLALLGPTQSLLAVAAVSAAMFLWLVVMTGRRYPAQLAGVENMHDAVARPTVRAVARNRYVLLIVAFQMLSAVESQWLDYNMLAGAAQRYDDSDALARFVSEFSAIAYGADILFLLVGAGFLLRRFGLRYGLVANAIGVMAVLGAIVVTSSFMGSGGTIVFALIVAARVTDLTLSDGASRTSLSAAYQAVPTRLRPVAQATVEGLAIPVAIGASGIVLLLIPSARAANGLVLPILTLLVVIAWTVVGVLLFRQYRVNLLANLRGRTLDGASMDIEEEGILFSLDQLLESSSLRDIRLGLDILTSGHHPELHPRLVALVGDGRPEVRAEALERLQHVDVSRAAASARTALDDPSAAVQAAGLRVLGTVGDRTDLHEIVARWEHADADVRVAAAAALTRLGDDELRARVATEVSRLARGTNAEDRALAANVLAGVPPGTSVDRGALRTLLDDPDPHVVNQALDALRVPEDTGLVIEIARHLDDRRTASAALDALVRLGDSALVVIDAGLHSDRHHALAQEMLVRAGRDIGGASAVGLLRGHVAHRDREVGLAVMRALAVLGPTDTSTAATLRPPEPDDEPVDVTASVVGTELEHAAHALRALIAFEGVAAASLQCRALRDELALIRARVLAAFSMRHGVEGFGRAVFQLAQRDPRTHALALEWLEVSLSGVERAAVALLDPRLSDRQRFAVLTRTFPMPVLSQRETLLELVEDLDGRWRRPWVRACALYTAFGMSGAEFDLIAAAGNASASSRDASTDDDIVHETLAGIRARRLDGA